MLGELTDNSQISDVNSYVATGVAVFNDFIMATSGSDGHLTTLSKSDLTTIDTNRLNDVRSIAISDTYIAALGVSPATLYVLNINNPTTFNEYIIAGNTSVESKSTLAIDGDFAYVSLNDGGLKIVNLNDDTIVQSIDKPQTPEGENETDYVTNAVSVNDELVFIANGAVGVYVGKKYNDTDVEIYGSADLNSSTNYVVSTNNIVFVATGFGGFKILEIQHSEFSNNTIITQEGRTNFDYQYGEVKYNFANTNTKEHYLGLGDLSISSDRVDANYSWSIPGE